METNVKDSNKRILRWRQDLRKQEEWETYKWKCIRCEQSLTHVHFDNDALMPYLENPLSDQPSIPPHALLPEGDSSRTEKGRQDAESHQLLCNECKYDIDDHPKKNLIVNGHLQSPIRSSRYLKYDSFLCRHLPGLADISSRKEFIDIDPPRHWPTYMVRCTECKNWKEIRHYLNGSVTDKLRFDFLSSGCHDLKKYHFLRHLTNCDECIDVQGTELSSELALRPTLHRIYRLQLLDFTGLPGIFGGREPIAEEKSLAYVKSIRIEFIESEGKRGFNRERFREEGFTNFRFEPDGQKESLDDEDIQKLETYLDYFMWLLRAAEIVRPL